MCPWFAIYMISMFYRHFNNGSNLHNSFFFASLHKVDSPYSVSKCLRKEKKFLLGANSFSKELTNSFLKELTSSFRMELSGEAKVKMAELLILKGYQVTAYSILSSAPHTILRLFTSLA